MAIKEYSRSTRAAIIIVSMAATYLFVFVLTILVGNAMRNQPNPPTTPPAQSPYETIPPHNESLTTAQMECPLPIPTSKRKIGEVIVGDKKYYNITVQRVAMSHDGRRVVLGSPWVDRPDIWSNAEDTTTVKVFDFNGNKWEGAGIFSGRLGDKYGFSISLSGDGKMIAIGAIWTNVGSKIEVGQVETYHFSEKNTWISVGQKLTGVNDYDLFGRSISLSDDGSRMAISAVWTDVNGENSGSVYIYELREDTWTQIAEAIHGEAAGDEFGNTVSMSGDGSIVAIGAPYSGENGSESGSVRVFQYSSERRTMQETHAKRNDESIQDKGEWIQVGKKILGGTSKDWFGNSLSINKKGNTLAVGTYAETNYYAEVYNLENNELYQLGNTLVGENYFGYSVSFAPSTHRLAVGPYDSNGGYIDIYDFVGNNWVLIEHIVAPPSEIYFGSSVSLSACGNQIAIGSTNNTHGHISVYEFV